MLDGKIALVTGAARGIGKSIATALACAGASVALHHHQSAAEARSLCSELEDGTGKMIAVNGDLSNLDEVNAVMDAVEEQLGAPAILINNAGGGYLPTPLADVDLPAWRSLFALDLEAPLLLCQRALPSMRKKKWGRIVHIGSNAVRVRSPLMGPYVASKAALHAITSVMAKEEGRNNILINTVAPGIVDTGTGDHVAHVRQRPTDPLAFVDAIPLQRLCKPADVANLVLFLCSDHAAYITGQVIYLNGGDRIETFSLNSEFRPQNPE